MRMNNQSPYIIQCDAAVLLTGFGHGEKTTINREVEAIR